MIIVLYCVMFYKLFFYLENSIIYQQNILNDSYSVASEKNQ